MSVYSFQAPTWRLACLRFRFPGSYEPARFIEFEIRIEILHMRFDLQRILPDQLNLLDEGIQLLEKSSYLDRLALMRAHELDCTAVPP